MARRDGTTWAPLKLYESAARTAQAFGTLVEQGQAAGVTPSAEVLTCQTDLADIALEEAQTLQEITDLADNMSGTAEDAANLLARPASDTTPDDRLRAVAKVLGATAPDVARGARKMTNQATFRAARKAAQRWHNLGDGLLTGLISPWAAQIITELETLAGHVIEGGHPAMVEAEAFAVEYEISSDDIATWQTMPARYHAHYKRLRATELTHQFRHLAEDIVELELRDRGLLPTLRDDSGIPKANLVFIDPTQLPELRNLNSRPALWMAEAIANGARPALRTAAEVAKTSKPTKTEAPAMAT